MSDSNRSGKTGPPALFRVKLRPDLGGKTVAWIQKRVWFFFAKDWYPADNRRRFAMAEFIRHVREAEAMMELVEESKDDEANARRFVEQYKVREGISQWRVEPRIPREDALPDCTKEYEDLAKKFKGRFRSNDKQKLGTPRHATRSRYVPDNIAPSLKLDGSEAEYDYQIPFRRSENQGNQNQNRQRNKGRQPNQNQKGKDGREIHVHLSDDDD